MKKSILFFLLNFINLYSIQDSELFKKDLRLVSAPVAGIYTQPNTQSSFDSQKVYGHEVQVVEIVDNEWVKVRTDDGICNYCQHNDLMPDNVLWRTSNQLQRIKSLIGCVYPEPNIRTQTVLRLPYNAYVKVINYSDDNNWAQVELIDGSLGWIMTGDIEPIKTVSIQQAIERSQQFIGLPYIWGGVSSFGFDCSGFVQTLARQMSYPMLRDAGPQSRDTNLLDIAYEDIQPGDFVYINGAGTRAKGYYGVNHVAFCIAPNTIIHAATIGNLDKIMVTPIDHPRLHFVCAKRIPRLEYKASICKIDDEILKKMTHSWQDANPVPLKDLRYLKLRYWGFDNCMHDGEMIVHAQVAQEVVNIFKELFEKRFPIERMNLIDYYEAIDGFACADNNSSAFCSRLLTNSTTKWSLHSFGIAIDINTRLNPYHNDDYIGPVNGVPFLDRTIDAKGLIREDDICVQAFKKRNWKWAGEWQEKYGYVDYQHFYKDDHMSDELTALAQKYTPQLD